MIVLHELGLVATLVALELGVGVLRGQVLEAPDVVVVLELGLHRLGLGRRAPSSA